MARLRVGVLISGRGSNLRALIAACREPTTNAEIALVISNRPEAAGLAFAAEAKIPALVVDHKRYGKDRAAFDGEMDRHLRAAGVEFVCLAGFMRLLTAEFIAGWHNKMINIHPSLLPAFRGVRAVGQALEAGAKLVGCSVHFVRHEMDTGPIVAQAAVPVLPGDDEQSLADRVLAQEQILYPRVLRWVANGQLRWAGERVIVPSADYAVDAFHNPR